MRKEFLSRLFAERVNPGNPIYKTKNTLKVVETVEKNAIEVIAAMYRSVLGSDISAGNG